MNGINHDQHLYAGGMATSGRSLLRNVVHHQGGYLQVGAVTPRCNDDATGVGGSRLGQKPMLFEHISFEYISDRGVHKNKAVCFFKRGRGPKQGKT